MRRSLAHLHPQDADIQAYGLPGGRDAGFAGQKVAEYNGGRLIPSAAGQTGVVDPANRRPGGGLRAPLPART